MVTRVVATSTLAALLALTGAAIAAPKPVA